MKILVLGVRGVPNVEGGVETHVEQLYPRLAANGCSVEIVVRTPFVPPTQCAFGSIRLQRIWSPRTQGLEAFVHSILGAIYAGATRPDILHIHAVGPAIVTPLARLLGVRVVVTNHGPDYDRDKWGPLARGILRLGESLGMRYANGRIAISKVIADLVRDKYGCDSALIPNGVVIHEPQHATDRLAQWNLEPRRYFLHVGRMVPEKRQLDLIRAYQRVLPVSWRLVLVGRIGEDQYSQSVVAAAREAGAVLPGFLAGTALQQIYSHAGAFVLPSSHEGLPIALLEALSYGLPVIASDIPANVAIGLDRASYFALGNVAELAARMRATVDLPANDDDRARRRRWVAERYDWDRVAVQTRRLYSEVLGAAT